jgi:hypothetical protein
MPTPLEATLYAAVRHALDRMQAQPEFRWHMLGTTTFDLLIEAEAAFIGRTVDEVRADRSRDLQPEHRIREAECSVNRDRVRDLEGLLEEHGIAYPPRED